LSGFAASRPVIALVFAALACGGEGAPPGAQPDAPPDGTPDAPPAVSADRRPPGLDERGRLTMDSLGVLATYGLDEAAGPDAVLQRPMDAAFMGDHVLVLDASAPWVRRFERDGRFVSALVGRRRAR
jgi:hypothetical protein